MAKQLNIRAQHLEEVKEINYITCLNHRLGQSQGKLVQNGHSSRERRRECLTAKE